MSAPMRQIVFDLEEAGQLVDELAGQALGDGRRDLAEKAVKAGAIISAALNNLLEYPESGDSSPTNS